MIKKIMLSALVVIVAAVLALAGYLFSLKEDTPNKNIKPSALLHSEQYKRNALEAEQWLQAIYQHNTVPSFSAAVGVNGQLVWQGTIGFADISSAVRADHNTQYRIGSVSKSMTATAAMRMHEKNLLSLEAPFKTIVKDYPTNNAGFTIKQLLAHQGGVRHYRDQLRENFSNREYATTREAAALVEGDALLFLPGEGFHYTTYGYTLVALAMETAHDIAFEQIMYNEVFTPAAMPATAFAKASKHIQSSQAVPYLHIGESLYQAPNVNLSNKYAGGGYLSTPSDLVHFANALLNNTLLSEQATQTLWTPVALNNGAANRENYALGFRVGQDDKGRFVHHGGKSVGGYCFLLIYPEHHLVVAFATNVTPAGDLPNRLEAAQQLAQIFLEK